MKTIINTIDQSILDGISSYEAKIKVIEANKDKHIKHLQKLKDTIPELEKEFENQGLSIHSLNSTKTGMNTDWEDGDSLNVSMKCSIINKNKVRLLKHSRGGKNSQRLKEKASKLQNTIKDNTSVESVSVNQYSFESKDKERELISLTIWIKL